MDKEVRDCPFCSEEVLAAALKCKHCGSDIRMINKEAKQARLLGFLSLLFGFFTGIPAVIWGLKALFKFKKNPEIGGAQDAGIGIILGLFLSALHIWAYSQFVF